MILFRISWQILFSKIEIKSATFSKINFELILSISIMTFFPSNNISNYICSWEQCVCIGLNLLFWLFIYFGLASWRPYLFLSIILSHNITLNSNTYTQCTPKNIKLSRSRLILPKNNMLCGVFTFYLLIILMLYLLRVWLVINFN